MSSVIIKANDVFEELSEENKRLLTDLTFANECLLKLLQLKSFLELIFDKISYTLEECDSQKYQDLNNEVNQLLQRRLDIKNWKNNDNQTIDNLNDYENDIKFSHCLSEINNKLSEDCNYTDYECSSDITTGRMKISNKNKLNSCKSLAKRETNGLNGKNRSRRGRKPKITSDLNIDSNGIKPKKELIVCDYSDCDQVFKTPKSYKTHKRLIHLQIKPFACQYPDCNYGAISKSQLETHQIIHSDERPFVCQIGKCGKAFKAEMRLKTHQKFVHKVCAELFRCEWPGCEFETVRQKNLDLHITTHTMFEKNIACDWPECDKMFRTNKAMRHHRLVHTAARKYACTHPGCLFRTYRNDLLRQHMVRHSDVRPFACDIGDCGKTFKTMFMLKSHKKSHIKIANPNCYYKCEVEGCDKKFINKHTLKNHSKTHLPANLRCDWPGCTYITTTTKNLAKHMFVHQDYNERKYVCDWPECGKRFKEKCRMDEHYRQHTNERRYACTFPGCSYRCVIKGNLTKHIAKHSK